MSRTWLIVFLVLGLVAPAKAAKSKRTPWGRAYRQARKLAKAGQYSKAARLLKRSLDLASKPTERVRSLSTMGKVLEAANKPDLALKSYRYGLKEIDRGGVFPIPWIRKLRANVRRLETAEEAVPTDHPDTVLPALVAPPVIAVEDPFFARPEFPTSETSETSGTTEAPFTKASNLLASTNPNTRIQAIPLLEVIAARGDGKAMRMLGLVHIADAVGERSREAGLRFLELAADEGDEIAKRLLRGSRDPNELAGTILSEGLIGSGSVAD